MDQTLDSHVSAVVIAGLVPAIHEFMDARHKAGHDYVWDSSV